jgi:hypothetical protein
MKQNTSNHDDIYEINVPEIKNKYDREFINLILEIEKRYVNMIKHDRLKLENWIKKLCIPTDNIEWKKNRNLHAILMLDMVLNNKLGSPYNKFADDNSIPLLSKSLVKSMLSDKFQEISLSECEENLNKFLLEHVMDKYDLHRISKLKENKNLLKQSILLIVFITK